MSDQSKLPNGELNIRRPVQIARVKIESLISERVVFLAQAAARPHAERVGRETASTRKFHASRQAGETIGRESHSAQALVTRASRARAFLATRVPANFETSKTHFPLATFFSRASTKASTRTLQRESPKKSPHLRENQEEPIESCATSLDTIPPGRDSPFLGSVPRKFHGYPEIPRNRATSVPIKALACRLKATFASVGMWI
ncbi:hypothetical protein KM043_004531 [Ampulex compressa]|nr:hypothetical protein KM043_004531 [Ampulex compressa]